MSDIDPFADVVDLDSDVEPFTEPDPPAKKAAPKKVVVKPADGSEGKIVLTFKEGAGFDSSWTVVHANSVSEGLSILNDPEFKSLLDQSKKVATYYRGGSAAGGASSGGGAPARPGNEAPAGVAPAPGPDWTFKTGVGKNGKPWKAWMPPRGSDAQPVWL